MGPPNRTMGPWGVREVGLVLFDVAEFDAIVGPCRTNEGLSVAGCVLECGVLIGCRDVDVPDDSNSEIALAVLALCSVVEHVVESEPARQRVVEALQFPVVLVAPLRTISSV